MILWFVLTVTTSVATVLIAAPLILKFERARAASTVAVARGVPREAKRDLSEATIQPEEANAVGPADEPVRSSLLSGHRVVAVASTGVLAVAGVYALVSGFDFAPASRGSSTTATVTPAPEVPQGKSEDGRQSQAGLPSVEELTRRLAARLQQNPRDAEGWRLLGLSYANTGRHADAAAAFARAIELNPTNADIRGARVEALVAAAGGQVSAEAAAAIEEGLALAPANPQLRFFKGLSKEQAGDKEAAYAIWSDILKQDDPKESWADDMRRRLQALGRDLGVAIPSQPAAAEPGTAGAMLEFLQSRERSAPAAAIPGNGAGSPDSTGATPAADNSAMIRGMVESLAKRLEQTPNDVDGWLKLMRSRVVLGEPQLAKQALESALRASGQDAQAREKVMALAGQLGVR